MQTFEGWSETTGKAFPHLNPGNLKFAGQANAIKAPDDFAQFPDFYSGKQAQLNDLMAKFNAGLHTIRAIISAYAPPSDNNTEAYIESVLTFFSARNIDIPADYDIPTALAQFKNPVILVAVNQLWKPIDWAAIQSAITACAKFMPPYAFSCRYPNAGLDAGNVIESQVQGLGVSSAISIPTTRAILTPYSEGQTLNVLIYDQSVMVAKLNPVGGCEWQGTDLNVERAPVSAIASVMYQGAEKIDWLARAIFHELIHELFSLTEQTDDLHLYLQTHGGYQSNLAVDLEAVFTGNDLNTPQAITNLEAEKNNL